MQHHHFWELSPNQSQQVHEDAVLIELVVKVKRRFVQKQRSLSCSPKLEIRGSTNSLSKKSTSKPTTLLNRGIQFCSPILCQSRCTRFCPSNCLARLISNVTAKNLQFNCATGKYDNGRGSIQRNDDFIQKQSLVIQCHISR